MRTLVVAIYSPWAPTTYTYTYDTVGNILTATGTMAEANPLRYRGYYFDSETGFYYLQSRYYDPTVCRFINADGYASTGQGIVGHNMFAYCNNSPVYYKDSIGSMRKPCTVYINDGASHTTGTIYYVSPTAAALAFAENEYYITQHSRREISALIYEVNVNNVIYYDYGYLVYESRHSKGNPSVDLTIEPWKCGGSFNGKRIVGEVHTHPYSSKFSDRDILAISQNIAVLGADYKAYLVCPDLSVRIFDPTSHNPQNGIFVGTFTPKTRKLYGGSNIISRTHILR